MTQGEKRIYLERPNKAEHINEIPPQKEDMDRSYSTLLSHVFTLQNVVYRQRATDPDSANSLPSRTEIARAFYEDKFVTVGLRRGRGGVVKVPQSEFIDSVPLSPCPKGENQLFYLLGPVGCGKTTYVNYLLTRHSDHWLRSQGIWFLKVDMFVAGKTSLITYTQMLDKLIQKLRAIVTDPHDPLELSANISPYLEIVNQEALLKEEVKEEALATFVKRYRLDTGRQLFLILDNLDYFYHYHDMESFTPDGMSSYEEAVRTVTNLVSSFVYDAGPLGSMGANVLFVLRNESHAVLQVAKELLPDPSVRIDFRTFEVEMPRWEEVLKARGNLLLWAISQVKKKGLRNSLAERAKPLVEDILQIGKKSSKFLEHLKHLNIYGLRDLMEFFQNYSWLEGRALRNGGPDDGLSRLVEHHPVGLIAYMLHRKLLYSQHNSPFPNIYLVNNKAPFIERDAVPHSYWLKSLILRYICAQAKEATDPEQIIRTFHQDGDGYSRKLIQACLGSMCIASASGLIKLHRVPVRDKRLLTISNVTVSERGRYCMDEIFDKFVYLQLIVDDYMLPVPRVVGKDLVLGGRASDYAYLVAPKADYTHKGREMIRTKARKVRLFLVVLDEAWKCEREIWPGVMSRLKDAGVGLPNPKSMLEDVDEEFGRIAHVFPGTIAVEAVRHYSESRREEIRQALIEGYLEGTSGISEDKSAAQIV